ncbi:MAG: AAA family ATPase [Clostridia bacterium]
MLVIISGPSGSGKNTIINSLINRNKGFQFLLSCTTRSRRENEEKPLYIYLTKNEMQTMIANGQLFEHEEVHGEIYGVLNSSIQEIVSDKIYLKDIDVNGKRSFEKRAPKNANIISIFLDCQIEELEKRLKNRGEKDIEKRLSRAEYEKSFKNDYDYIIENNNQEETISKIEEIIKASSKQKKNE